jgi:hypothetical protein
MSDWSPRLKQGVMHPPGVGKSYEASERAQDDGV